MLKVRRQKAAKDHAVIYINCTKRQYLNCNRRKLKVGYKQTYKLTQAKQTILITEQLFHKLNLYVTEKVVCFKIKKTVTGIKKILLHFCGLAKIKLWFVLFIFVD